MLQPHSVDEGWQITKDYPFWLTVWATRKAGRSLLGWEDVINKDLKDMGTSWEDLKREALNRLGWRRSMCSSVCLRRLSAAVSYH